MNVLGTKRATLYLRMHRRSYIPGIHTALPSNCSRVKAADKFSKDTRHLRSTGDRIEHTHTSGDTKNVDIYNIRTY